MYEYLGIAIAVFGGMFLWFAVAWNGLKRKKAGIERIQAAFERTVQSWLDFWEAIDRLAPSDSPHKGFLRAVLNTQAPAPPFSLAETQVWLNAQQKAWETLTPLLAEKHVPSNAQIQEAGPVLCQNLTTAFQNLHNFRKDYEAYNGFPYSFLKAYV
jgi:hypothetical protein